MKGETMFQRRSSEKVIGTLDHVSFPDFGVPTTLAKIDTGAFSGALHCTDIKVVVRGKDRQRVLKFTPLGKKKYATETTDFQSTYIRSSTGHRVRRHIITTSLEWNGTRYPITIGLSDRHTMKREVLIGRRFLREHNIKVDTRINQELDDEGELTR